MLWATGNRDRLWALSLQAPGSGLRASDLRAQGPPCLSVAGHWASGRRALSLQAPGSRPPGSGPPGSGPPGSGPPGSGPPGSGPPGSGPPCLRVSGLRASGDGLARARVGLHLTGDTGTALSATLPPPPINSIESGL